MQSSKMKAPILLIAFMIPSTLLAVDSEDLMHGAAHFGATYAMTHIGEVVCKKVTKQSKLACTIESALIANAINVGRKAYQGFPNDTNRAVVTGLAGSVTAGLIITIDW